MKYMRKNMNFLLAFLLLLVIVAFVSLAAYYQDNLQEYNLIRADLEDRLQSAESENAVLKDIMNETSVQYEIKNEREEELTDRFTDVSETNTKLTLEVESTKSELSITRTQLDKARADLKVAQKAEEEAKSDLADAKVEIKDLKDDVNKLEDDVDELETTVCSLDDSFSYC